MRLHILSYSYVPAIILDDMDDHDAEEKENETCYGSNIDGKDKETTEEDVLKCRSLKMV